MTGRKFYDILFIEYSTVGKVGINVQTVKYDRHLRRNGGERMNIQERRNKDGKITSYRIRVFDHRDTDTGKQVFKNLSDK